MSTYGQWRRTSTSGTTTSVNDTYVVFGSKSPSSAVTSGTGHYSTVLDGTFVNKNGAYAVNGTGTFDANFGSGTIAYSTTARRTPETGGTAILFGTMTGDRARSRQQRRLQRNRRGQRQRLRDGCCGQFLWSRGPGNRRRVPSKPGNGGSGIGAIAGN